MTAPRPAPASRIDPALFPPAFLRFLATVDGLVRRARAGADAGARAAGGAGGAFLFRGHREYRPGDDLRRLDWGVLGRLDRAVVREHEAERDLRTEVVLDGSASLRPFDGWPAAARAAALCAAIGLAGGEAHVRLSVLRGVGPTFLPEAEGPAGLEGLLAALSSQRPEGTLDLAAALPAFAVRLSSRARLVLVSDLLTAAPPETLFRVAGRGRVGTLLHLRVPEATAPEPGAHWLARDVETGATREVRFTAEVAARVAARAQAHADRWAHAARQVGLAYLPFAPSTAPDVLLGHLVRGGP